MIRTTPSARACGAWLTVVSSLLAIPPASPVFAGEPANDDCADAINVALGETPFTTEEATSAGPGVCVNFGKDIWFKHRARFTGVLRVTLCDAANFDSVIAVYRGASCNDNNLLANLIGCNDDKSAAAMTPANWKSTLPETRCT
jgi:hypothetical protein